MSGHSHWATTKRAKGIKDAARGKVFSKISKVITIAAKGGPDPDSNPRLRMAIAEAKAVNMPKENIDRAILKGSKQDMQLEEFSYEGFGPSGIGIIVEVATDNRNRTAAEIKNIFEKGGGTMAGPGAVAFNFDPKGLIIIGKGESADDQILSLIDLGVQDLEEGADVIEAYVNPSELGNVKTGVEKLGYVVKSVELTKKPKNYVFLEDKETAKKALTLLENLEDHDDVQKVHTNADMPDDLSH